MTSLTTSESAELMHAMSDQRERELEQRIADCARAVREARVPQSKRKHGSAPKGWTVPLVSVGELGIVEMEVWT